MMGSGKSISAASSHGNLSQLFGRLNVQVAYAEHGLKSSLAKLNCLINSPHPPTPSPAGGKEGMRNRRGNVSVPGVFPGRDRKPTRVHMKPGWLAAHRTSNDVGHCPRTMGSQWIVDRVALRASA